MIQRIVLCMIGALVFIFVWQVVMPLWIMETRSESISYIFEKTFDIFPEEKQQIFPTSNTVRKICYGKIEICFHDAEEACSEFEKRIDELLAYYKKYNWIVNLERNLQFKQYYLCEIKTRVIWLRTRA